jgi:hypothetical protein
MSFDILPNYIFLDFDGVLNSAKWMDLNSEKIRSTSLFERSCEELNPQQVEMMSTFASETNAKVVISSSWKVLHTLEEIILMLKLRGWKDAPIIGITPDDPKRFRGSEVKAFIEPIMKATNWYANYVIFDDGTDFYPGQPLIKTDWEIGLTHEHIIFAGMILQKEAL